MPNLDINELIEKFLISQDIRFWFVCGLFFYSRSIKRLSEFLRGSGFVPESKWSESELFQPGN